MTGVWATHSFIPRGKARLAGLDSGPAWTRRGPSCFRPRRRLSDSHTHASHHHPPPTTHNERRAVREETGNALVGMRFASAGFVFRRRASLASFAPAHSFALLRSSSSVCMSHASQSHTPCALLAAPALEDRWICPPGWAGDVRPHGQGRGCHGRHRCAGLRHVQRAGGRWRQGCSVRPAQGGRAGGRRRDHGERSFSHTRARPILACNPLSSGGRLELSTRVAASQQTGGRWHRHGAAR